MVRKNPPQSPLNIISVKLAEQKKEEEPASKFLYNLILQKPPAIQQHRANSITFYKRKKRGFGESLKLTTDLSQLK